MNYKIEKIYKEATGKDFAYDFDPIIAEKFAELIVKTCASIAIDTDLEDVEGGDNDVLRAAANQIKQHFGVK